MLKIVRKEKKRDNPEVAIAHLEERAKSNSHRLDDHEKRIDSLEKTYSIMEKMNYRMEKMETAVEKIDKKLDAKVHEDNQVKGKKWDKLIDYLFYAVLALLLGYIAMNLGLKQEELVREYLVIGIISILVFIILFVIIKCEKVRNRANALFLQAEKHVTEDKLQYVSDNLYQYVTSTIPLVGIFIKDEAFKQIVQKLYDETRELAKDLLDDGKLNKSNEEE